MKNLTRTLPKALIAMLLTVQPTLATGVAKDWQLGFQDAATPIMERVSDLHDLLMWIIVGISAVVIALVAYVLIRFRASRNPHPSKTSHNTMLEVVWTAIPVVILIIIGIPSIKLLFFTDTIEKSDMTIKAIGHQWYWTYEYPDEEISYDSYMVEDKDIKEGQYRLLEVDRRIVVPVGATVKVLVTADDVLHSFAVPSFGVKMDAVPGRVNETWFRVNKEGVYYGQCSELCGAKHGFMPIAVEVVSKEAYQEWLRQNDAKSLKPKVAETPSPAANGKAQVATVSAQSAPAAQPAKAEATLATTNAKAPAPQAVESTAHTTAPEGKLSAPQNAAH